MNETSGSSATQEPVILLVGAGATLKDGLVEALGRHGISVEAVSTDLAQEAVVVAAPDLVVLADEAARDAGVGVLDELASSPMSSVVPVVVLGDSPTLEDRLEAFRRGAAAVLARTPSMDHTASRLAELVKEIPDRTSQTFDELGESTLLEFVQALSEQLRAQVLARQSSSVEPESDVRLVFGGGRPLAKLVDEFVQRLGHHVVHAEAVAHDLVAPDGLGSNVLRAADLGPEVSEPASLGGLRVALADDDVARADAVAQDLRARGATVLVIDPAPSAQRFARLRQLDPSVIVIGDEQVRAVGRELVRRVHADMRLRWATLLIAQWDRLYRDSAELFALDQLANRLSALRAAEHELQRRLHQGFAFDTRLEATGPARLLYALAEGPAPIRVTVQAPRARVELDLAERLIVGATATRLETEPMRLEGPRALALLLELSSGRVRIAPANQPATANLMSAVDLALNLADRELESGAVPAIGEAPALEPEPDASAPIPDSLTFHSLASPPGPTEAGEPGRGDDAGGTNNTDETEEGPASTPKRRSRLPAAAIGIAAVLVIGTVGLLVLRSRDRAPTVSRDTQAQATAPKEPIPEPVTESPAASSAPTLANVSSDAGPIANYGVLPVATNPTTPSCQELLGDKEPPEKPKPAASYQSMTIGRKAMVRGNVREAQRAYCGAVRYDPSNASAQAELARLLLIQRDANAGLKQVRTALGIEPDSRVLQGLLGDALARLGRYDEARSAWRTEAQLGREDTDQALVTIFIRTARQLRARHTWGEAERFYRRVAVIDPSNVEASLGVARSLQSLGELDEAKKWVAFAEGLKETHPEYTEIAKELGIESGR